MSGESITKPDTGADPAQRLLEIAEIIERSRIFGDPGLDDPQWLAECVEPALRNAAELLQQGAVKDAEIARLKSPAADDKGTGLRERLTELAIAYHRNPHPEGEGEYGCTGGTCPGVQRLLRFAEAAVALGAAYGSTGGSVIVPSPGIVACLVSSALCYFCGAKAAKCLGDEDGRLYPSCGECHGKAYPLFDVPTA